MYQVKKKDFFIITSLATAGVAGFLYFKSRPKKKSSLSVETYIDINRYMGTWYEIARLPTPFEKDCYNTKAHYSIEADGSIKIINSCNKDNIYGELDSIAGRGTIDDPVSNAKLKVEFMWPFTGDYWIIKVGPNYDYALVGEPNKKYLWILSRDNFLDNNIFNELLQVATENGYTTNNLILTKHRLHN